MPKHARSLVVVLLATGVIAGCDQGTEPGNPDLSPAEARALAVMIDNRVTSAADAEAESGGQFSLAPSGEPSQDISAEHSFEATADCPLAGEASLDGNLTLEAGEGFLQVDLVATAGYLGCEFATDEDVEIALDGSLAFEAERSIDEDGFYGLNVHTGSLDFSTSEGESGTCDIDLTAEASFAPGSGSAMRTISGNVCGHEVTANSEWNWTITD